MSGDVVTCVMSKYCLFSIRGHLKEDLGLGKYIYSCRSILIILYHMYSCPSRLGRSIYCIIGRDHVQGRTPEEGMIV